mgnify:CR=1 FL=1
MKKLLLLLALVGMVAYGCTDSSTDDDNNPSTEQPGPSGDEDLAFTNNTNTAPTISHEGGTAKISFTAALSWSVSVYADWLSVSDDEGEAGNGSFVITAEPNTTAKERKGVVAIKLSNHKSYEITVKQSFNADSDDIEFINNTNTAPHMEFGGGTVQIAFLAKTDWTVTCYADWLSTSKSSGSKGENSFFITAASNPKEEERSGVVAIKSKNNKSYEIKVTQDPNAGIMQLTVAANEVLYTTVFDTQIKLYNESGFGGNLISHSYDVEKGYGSIRFDNYVTSIPSQAFKDCTTLESIYLPEGVTYIAPDAFEGCTNLKYIISPNSTNYSMFIYNGEIMAVVPSVGKELVIPEGVKIVGQNIFTNSKVEKIVFPKSMENIKYRAFYQHPTLQSVVFNGYTNIDDYAFNGCYSLESVTYAVGNEYGSYKIGSHAFEKCEKLKTVLLAEGLATIQTYTFSESGLIEIIIPGADIGEKAFSGCQSLQRVNIEEGTSYIGVSAFEECRSLENIVLPKSVEEIRKSAFAYNTKLKSINIPESITSIGGSAFYGCTGELTINCKQLIEKDYTSTSYPAINWLKGANFSKLIIGDAITSIGDYVFYELNKEGSLTDLVLGDNLSVLGKYALPSATNIHIGNCIVKDCDYVGFGKYTNVYISDLSNYCQFDCGDDGLFAGNSSILYVNGEAVTELTIPQGVTSLNGYAFCGCGSLKKVIISEGVSYIGKRAFERCYSLEYVDIASTVTHMYDGTFFWCDSIKEVYCRPTVPPSTTYGNHFTSSLTKLYVPRESVEAYKSASYWNRIADQITGYDF